MDGTLLDGRLVFALSGRVSMSMGWEKID